jgi:hypothetical protein
VWSSTYGNAVQQVESVQRKFTKRLSRFSRTDCSGALNIDSLHPDVNYANKVLLGWAAYSSHKRLFLLISTTRRVVVIRTSFRPIIAEYKLVSTLLQDAL